MSYSDTGVLSPADIGAIMGNNNGGNGGWFGNGISDLIALIIVGGIFGFGGGFGGGLGGGGGILPWILLGGGFGGGLGGGGTAAGYTLVNDMSMLSRQMSDGFAGQERRSDAIINGLCDGFYQQAQLVAGINQNLAAGFSAAELAEANRQAALMQQLFGVNMAIGDVKTQSIFNARDIQTQIQQCCCDNEKATMQARFDAAQYNCATMAAIDKLGDRIIGHLEASEKQGLRDQIDQYRAEANARAIVAEVNKCPVPAYLVCNPNAPINYGVTYGNNCGCA